MNRRQLKKHILTLLDFPNLGEIYGQLQFYPRQSVLNPLFIALCHQKERVRWNAVCCFGQTVPAMAEDNLESARVVMRRFLWTLNDESGGIGWGAPESMAEIMVHSDQLRKEYLHMLISYMREDGEELFQDGNYLELPLLQRGLLWGVGRLCENVPDEMIERGVTADLLAYLESPDFQVRGMALWALGFLKYNIDQSLVRDLLANSLELRVYLNGQIRQVPLLALLARVGADPSR